MSRAAVRLRVQRDEVGLPPGLEAGKADSLGLRLVHLLARQLHAEVEAVSGAGSTFFVSLPSEASSKEQLGSNSGKARILIVEDEALIAEDLRCTVLMLGYAVVAVTESGEQAVQEALELRPDLVLLDYQLQGPMNGVEAGKLIQQAVTAAVVFVSANANVLAQPFVVQKPFSRTTLSLVIAAALASSRNDHG